jgi:hypothetical protein
LLVEWDGVPGATFVDCLQDAWNWTSSHWCNGGLTWPYEGERTTIDGAAEWIGLPYSAVTPTVLQRHLANSSEFNRTPPEHTAATHLLSQLLSTMLQHMPDEVAQERVRPHVLSCLSCMPDVIARASRFCMSRCHEWHEARVHGSGGLSGAVNGACMCAQPL